MILLSAFLLAIVNYFAGDTIFLRADGILLTNRQVVAATYSAKVASVLIKEGDRVNEGDLLLKLESAEMLKDIAELAVRNADLSGRESELRVKAATVLSLLPLAERNARENSDTVARIDTMANRGLISSQSMSQALSSGYDAAAKLAELRGQSEVITKELSLVAASHDRANEALTQLETFYDHGAVRAASAGVVGSRVPLIGQVAKLGDELLQIFGDKPYVLAYLPDSYLFGISTGDRVEVSAGTGSRWTVGTVDAILGVADALPPEFQNTFRPRDRTRLVRIGLPQNHTFAISQKVRITGCVFGWCWRNGKTDSANPT